MSVSTSAVSVKIQAFDDTFEAFTNLTRSLEHNYLSLEERIAQLQYQLTEVRQKHRDEIEARDRIAKRLSSVLQGLPAGVVVLNPEGKVEDCNPAAVELLGSPLRNENWQDVVSRSFLPRSDDGHEISLIDGRLVNISTCPLGNDPGQILLIADVTETRRLQKYINQHQRLISMGEMVASLAHQIRTPLASALLSASQLKNPNLDTDRQQTIAERLISNMRHLENLVTDMLLFSREDHCSDDTMKISELINSLVSNIDPVVKQKNIHIESVDDCPNTLVRGNRSILQSALQNIIDNALHAVDEQGTITIQVKSSIMGKIDIVVTDDGPGIKSDIQHKLFDPFFTTKSQGTGLGLAVVKSIFIAHQGDVWHDADYINGSRFVLRLPTIDQQFTHR